MPGKINSPGNNEDDSRNSTCHSYILDRGVVFLIKQNGKKRSAGMPTSQPLQESLLYKRFLGELLVVETLKSVPSVSVQILPIKSTRTTVRANYNTVHVPVVFKPS